MRSSRTQGSDPVIEGFLERFTTALTAGEGQTVARHFEYPALLVMSNRGKYGDNQLLEEPDAVADFFSQAPEMYHAKGVQDTFPDVESLEWVADDLALVRVRFPYIDADGNDMGDGESSVYLVRREGQELSICAAITLGVDSDRLGSPPAQV